MVNTPPQTAAVVVRHGSIAAGVVAIELAARSGEDLLPWQPGAHIDLVLEDGVIRQYSLCGDPSDRTSYRIAVLREAAGRGASRRICDNLKVGDPVLIGGPRNHFRLDESPSYLFIAGGIGITPLLPMIEQVRKASCNWQLHYLGRRRTTMAFADRLDEFGARVTIAPSDEVGRINIDALLQATSRSTTVYCCGPRGLLDAVEDGAQRFGMRCRTERFAPVDADVVTNSPFVVRLQGSGGQLTVPADRSLLEVLLDAGIDIPCSCEEGTCGTCEVPVLGGIPEHRDAVLTAAERAAGDRMMACVSRARGEMLTLDL